MNEKTFIISMALDKYNSQFGTKFQAKNFEIFSIDPNIYYEKAYEIYSTRVDDYLRLRVYFNISDKDFLGPYRLEVTGPAQTAGLGDEVFVAIGTFDKYYLDEGIYKFRWIKGEQGVSINVDMVNLLHHYLHVTCPLRESTY